MENKRRLIWDEKALANLEQSLKRISEKLVSQAEKVEQAILQKIEETLAYPERNKPDKYKKLIPAITVLSKLTASAYPIGIQAMKSECYTAGM